MTKQLVLTKFAVRAIGINMPGNWDRPVGYEGHAHFVSAYWDFASDDVYITDGVVGRSGCAWWLYTNLVGREAHEQIIAALMAYGVWIPKAFGLLGATRPRPPTDYYWTDLSTLSGLRGFPQLQNLYLNSILPKGRGPELLLCHWRAIRKSLLTNKLFGLPHRVAVKAAGS